MEPHAKHSIESLLEKSGDTRNAAFSDTLLEHLAEEASLFRFVEIIRGSSSLVHIIQHEETRRRYAIKSAFSHSEKTQYKKEVCFNRFLQQIHFEFHAKVCSVDKGYTWFIAECIEGIPFEKNRENIHALANRIGTLHSFRVPRFGWPLQQRSSGSLEDYYAENIGWTQKQVDSLTDSETRALLLKSMSVFRDRIGSCYREAGDNQFSPIHFDLNPNNIILTEDGPRFIDWDQSSLGDPAIDVAKLFLKLSFQDFEEAVFLQKYPLSNTSFIERIESYRILVLIISIRWRTQYIVDSLHEISTVSLQTLRQKNNSEITLLNKLLSA